MYRQTDRQTDTHTHQNRTDRPRHTYTPKKLDCVAKTSLSATIYDCGLAAIKPGVKILKNYPKK